MRPKFLAGNWKMNPPTLAEAVALAEAVKAGVGQEAVLRVAICPPTLYLHRIDEVLVFHPLGPEALRGIVDLELGRMADRLDEHRISLSLTDAARDTISRQSEAERFGARLIRRTLQREVLDPLALGLLRGALHPGEHVVVDAGDGGLVLRVRQ